MESWNLVSHVHWDKVGLVLASSPLADYGWFSLDSSDSYLHTVSVEKSLIEERHLLWFDVLLWSSLFLLIALSLLEWSLFFCWLCVPHSQTFRYTDCCIPEAWQSVSAHLMFVERDAQGKFIYALIFTSVNVNTFKKFQQVKTNVLIWRLWGIKMTRYGL